MRTRTPRAGLAVALVAGLAAGTKTGAGPSVEDRPSLLLLTLDTTRADALGVNGAGPSATPHLDRLARGGANFRRARTTVPLTLPAHVSILTGLDPVRHGVRDNAGRRLADDVETLAERLRAEGYETAAFVASFVLDRRFGLAQGFDTYDDDVGFDPALADTPRAERRGDVVREAFAAWLAERTAARPFFAWVHLFDPHAPYEAPEPFRTRHPDDPYAAEVAYADAVAGAVVRLAESARPPGGLVVAVVGDHGESLGEHGETTHGLFVYLATIHVPLLLYAPGRVEPGRTVDALVSTTDLAATLLDYAGLGDRFGDGVSLRPLVEGEVGEADRVAYAESVYGRRHLGWSELHAVEAGRYRYVLAPRPELYDVAADPAETKSVVETKPGVARQLRRRLLERLAAAPRAAAEADTLDPETEARLRSLGYVTAPVAPPRGEGPTAGADPKDKIAVWEAIQAAIAAYERGDDEAVRRRLAPLAETEPDVPLVYEYWAAAALRAERWDEAASVYRRALARGLERASFHVGLGRVALARRRFGEAARELAVAAALDERSTLAWFYLGEARRGEGRLGEAEAAYRRALALSPRYSFAWNGLGVVLARTGRDAEALDAFREAVRLDPAAPETRFNLAVQLERTGRKDEARQAYAAFVERARGRPELAAQVERARRALARLGR